MDQDRELCCDASFDCDRSESDGDRYVLYDLAERDLEIAVGAFALSQLTTAREESALAAKESGPGFNSQLANTM